MNVYSFKIVFKKKYTLLFKNNQNFKNLYKLKKYIYIYQY